MDIIFMGTPGFAVPVLQALLASDYRVVAVCTQPDRRGGRKRQLLPLPVKVMAVNNRIPLMQPKTLRAPEAVEELARFHPDLIVVAAFGLILPRAVLALPPSGCLNVHPSLLPHHRGPSPVASAILGGDEVSGVSIMVMDEGMDTGAVLARQEVPISPEDTAGSLTARLAQRGAALLVDTLPRWLEGRIKPQPQDESQASYSRLLTSEDGELDWHLPAVELWRRVRAYNPWPGCYTRWQGRRLKVHQAVPLGDVKQGKIGEVVALPSQGVGVVTPQGVLELRLVQMEGKQEMPVAEFVRGQRSFIGSVLC
jgi:methionyl-tRNA formyltransferase